MNRLLKIIIIFASIAFSLLPAYSQFSEAEIEALMIQHIEVENPVFMPVVGVGIGYLNYYGNVNDAFRSYTAGELGYRINLAMFLSKETQKQFVRLNIAFLTGNLTGTQRYIPAEIPETDEELEAIMFRNLNFKSNINSFGINIHYNFRHLINRRQFEPFISVGASMLMFDTKTQGYTTDGDFKYYPWTDGTIRDAPQTSGNWNANIISKDYNFDKDVRALDRSGLGRYSQFAFSMPVDIGFDFKVAHRLTLRAATSFNFAFTDLIDDLSAKSKKTEYKGKRKNSMFNFTYLALNFDLFSDPEFKELVFNFIEFEDFDFFITEDTDGDEVTDWWDLCPDTPYGMGIVVDLDDGCPIDSDGDGIPDYLDHEPNSRPGAIVDENGVEITEEMFIEKTNTQSIRRSEVEAFLLMQRVQNRTRRGDLTIPEKFKSVDINNDGYISFDEFMKALNDFWDDNSNLTPNDLKELNDLFFEQ